MSSGILDPSGAAISSAHIANVRAEAFGPFGYPVAPSYRSASAIRRKWRRGGRYSVSADAAILPHRDLSTSRVRDLVRNDPHAVAGVAKLVDMLIGAGLRLSSKPDMRALGLNPAKKKDRKVARDIGEAIEAEWRIFADDPLRRCDAQRRLSMNGMFRLLCRTWVINGEATVALGWKNRGRYSTCVRAIDPDRLSNPERGGRPRRRCAAASSSTMMASRSLITSATATPAIFTSRNRTR
jgi:capsid protein